MVQTGRFLQWCDPEDSSGDATWKNPQGVQPDGFLQWCETENFSSGETSRIPLRCEHIPVRLMKGYYIYKPFTKIFYNSRAYLHIFTSLFINLPCILLKFFLIFSQTPLERSEIYHIFLCLLNLFLINVFYQFFAPNDISRTCLHKNSALDLPLILLILKRMAFAVFIERIIVL